MMKRTLLVAGLLAAALAPAQAQTFPNRPIKILVGFPAGGPSDVPARIIGDKLQKSLGQPVVVENKTGAAGMIALNEMLAQPRDGHTLLLCSYIDPTNTLLYKKVTYKLEDIAPVSLVTKAYYAFVVPADSPASNVKDFVAHAKAKPAARSITARSAPARSPRCCRSNGRSSSGIQMTGVTFRGTGPAMQEVVAGRLDFAVSPIAITMPLYEDKKIKVLGFTSPERPRGRADGADLGRAGPRHRQLRLVGRLRGVRRSGSRCSKRSTSTCATRWRQRRVQDHDGEGGHDPDLVQRRRIRQADRRHRKGAGRPDHASSGSSSSIRLLYPARTGCAACAPRCRCTRRRSAPRT